MVVFLLDLCCICLWLYSVVFVFPLSSTSSCILCIQQDLSAHFKIEAHCTLYTGHCTLHTAHAAHCTLRRWPGWRSVPTGWLAMNKPSTDGCSTVVWMKWMSASASKGCWIIINSIINFHAKSSANQVNVCALEKCIQIVCSSKNTLHICSQICKSLLVQNCANSCTVQKSF